MSGSSPCASCKLLRRRCAKDCIFAPYFPSDQPHNFATVHKVFGASNVSKMLQEVPLNQRADAVSSLVYEANARIRDPVYGCVGVILLLESQVSQLQNQLAIAQAEILCIQTQQEINNPNKYSSSLPLFQLDQGDMSLLLSSNSHSNLNHISQSVGLFSNSSGNNIIQDPFKKESFWA